MLSIIISSYQPPFYAALEKNIAETVGVPYEIIKIDNPGLMGICKAYNTGAQVAKFDTLLFIHEDILFHTQNWGEKLIHHLQDPETGIVGVAGSDYVPSAPSGWFINCPPKEFVNIIQNNKSGNTPPIRNTTLQKIHKVYVLDGVFLAIRSEIFRKFKFNEKLTGFHGYDTEISLHVAKKYLNYVVSDILIEHFSLGSPDKNFLDANILVRKLYRSDYQLKSDKNIEYERFNDFLYSMFKFHGVSFKNTAKIFRFFPWGKVRKRDYFKILKALLRYYKHRSYFEKTYSKE